jgi:hypothetical protein
MEPKPAITGSKSSAGTTEKLISNYLEQIQIALDKTMEKPRIALYLHGLSDLTEFQLSYAFRKALKVCVFLPTIAELREWATEGALYRHKLEAEKRSRQLLDRPSKPDDWDFKLEEAWKIIEERRKEQDRIDLVAPLGDEEWPKLNRSQIPNGDRYVDYARRRSARNRAASSVKRSVREEIGATFDALRSAELEQ